MSRSLTLPELEQRIQIDKTELDARKSQLADISAAIDAMPQRPAEIYARVTEIDRLVGGTESTAGIAE